MGWELAGYQCERGSTAVAPAPGAAGAAQARAAAEWVARRFEVKFASRVQVEAWQRDSGRSLYLLDVRTREEFERERIAASCHAPGGQLIQATDEFVAVRNARIVHRPGPGALGNDRVLAEPDGLERSLCARTRRRERFRRLVIETGARARVPGRLQTLAHGFPRPNWRGSKRRDRTRSFQQPQVSRSPYSGCLVGGARAAGPGTRETLEAARLVLTSEDATLAHLAAPEAAALWPDAEVPRARRWKCSMVCRAPAGRNRHGKSEHRAGRRLVQTLRPGAGLRKAPRAYLDWEVALVEQIKRDPAIRFRAYD